MTVDSTKREHAPPRAQSAHGSRRALARAVRGAALDLAEATVLLAGRGADLDVLCESAASVRDVGPEAADAPAW